MRTAQSTFQRKITSETFCSLKVNTWLKDDILNAYLAMVVEYVGGDNFSFLDTDFFTSIDRYSSNQQKLAGLRRKFDWAAAKKFLVPIYKDKHFVLSVIDIESKIVKLFDSYRPIYKAPSKVTRTSRSVTSKPANQFEEKIKNTLISFFTMKYNENFAFESIDCPQQKFPGDCGVFAAANALYIALNKALDYDATHIPYFRLRMMIELSSGVMIGKDQPHEHIPEEDKDPIPRIAQKSDENTIMNEKQEMRNKFISLYNPHVIPMGFPEISKDELRQIADLCCTDLPNVAVIDHSEMVDIEYVEQFHEAADERGKLNIESGDLESLGPKSWIQGNLPYFFCNISLQTYPIDPHRSMCVCRH